MSLSGSLVDLIYMGSSWGRSLTGQTIKFYTFLPKYEGFNTFIAVFLLSRNFLIMKTCYEKCSWIFSTWRTSLHHCKSYSPCSAEGQYYTAICAICIALFDAILSTTNAADTKRDAMALKKCTAGISWTVNYMLLGLIIGLVLRKRWKLWICSKPIALGMF